MVGRFLRLEGCFESSPVVRIGEYAYFVNPISDGVPHMDPDLLEEVVEGLIGISEEEFDMILAPEAMGIPLATGVSLRSGIPFSVIRKRQYGLPGEINVDQRTGYSKSSMFINGLSPGDRVMIVDDVVSTGGTLRSIVDTLVSNGITVSCVSVVFDKSDDIDAIGRSLGVPLRALIRVAVLDGRPVVIRRC
ncbi:MAG: adenine phosphoribosyltransferase [Candidatus Methanomethylophilaceae archaeon]|nr:adenine phosphoribosyltransferase [Candidatus Methanomethylophilaceae archaeon]